VFSDGTCSESVLTSTSVVALCKLYDLQDPRLAEVQVKGDLVVRQSDRIMTRSRARAQPDQYTTISAQLKIIKVLVEELLSGSGPRSLDAAAAAELEEEFSDDGDWEDDPSDFLDLGSGMTKAQLMALGAEDSAEERARDDETQTALLEFFRLKAADASFGAVFEQLTPAEQEKLRNMS
jgi:hypothetical protein